MDLRTVIVAVVHLGLVGIGAWLVVIDARTHRLPNRIVLPTLAGVLAFVLLDAALSGEARTLLRALVGALLLGGFYTVLRLLSPTGMGGGDVKLAVVIGMLLGWHGWQALAVGAASAFVLGALYALALIALRQADGATRIAFGPWMIAGTVVGILFG